MQLIVHHKAEIFAFIYCTCHFSCLSWQSKLATSFLALSDKDVNWNVSSGQLEVLQKQLFPAGRRSGNIVFYNNYAPLFLCFILTFQSKRQSCVSLGCSARSIPHLKRISESKVSKFAGWISKQKYPVSVSFSLSRAPVSAPVPAPPLGSTPPLLSISPLHATPSV